MKPRWREFFKSPAVVAVLTLLLLWLVCMLMASCGLSPEAQEAIEVLRSMERQGRISSEEASKLIAGFEKSGYGVRDLLFDALWAIGLYFGIMARRGPPERQLRISAARSR